MKCNGPSRKWNTHIWFVLLLSFTACQQETKQPSSDSAPADTEQAALKNPFFGIQPTDTPSVVGPGILSTAFEEYNGTFSPDGKAFFFTREVPGNSYIATMRLDDQNVWSEPVIAPFSGRYAEYDPLFAPDGKRLYFSSERPVSGSGKPGKTNIWYLEKQDQEWSEPIHVPLTGKGDYYSSLTQSGRLYFNVWSDGNIYHSTASDTGMEISEVDPFINSRSDVGDPFIAPDESYLIYRAFYPEGMGRGDLYIAFNSEQGWSKPQNLGSPINSPAHEICPWISPDGSFMLFSSDRLATWFQGKPGSSFKALEAKMNSYDNGKQNIYAISTSFIGRLRKNAEWP